MKKKAEKKTTKKKVTKKTTKAKYVISDETREKLRKASTGKNNWSFGHKTSDATKKKISDGVKAHNALHAKPKKKVTKKKK